MRGDAPSPALIALVRRCHAGGHTFAATGALLGLSRGQVAGIVWRHVRGKRSPKAARKPPLPEPAPLPARAHSGASCQYPHGDPKRPGFHFCRAPVARPDLPYCAQHLARCYLRLPAAAP